MRRAFATAILAIALAIPGQTPAQEQSRPGLTDMTGPERKAFRAEIRAYLMEHPEVIMEAIQKLEARRAAEERVADARSIDANREQLFHDANSWVGGNPDGDVTLVEFADYRCGYCKKAHPELRELLERDLNVRLVVKQFPILGPASVSAARMAQAALDLDPAKFEALNDALMSFEGPLSDAVSYQIASSAGYDIDALKQRAASAEIEARISDNYALARELGLQGTPSFVLGDRIIRGYLSVDRMQAAVADARAATN